MDILEMHIGNIKAEFKKLDSDKRFYKNSSEELLRKLNIITNDKDSVFWRKHQDLKLEIATLKKIIEEKQTKNAVLQAENQDLKENVLLKNVTEEEIQRLKKIIIDKLEKNAVLQVDGQDLEENSQLKNIMEENSNNNDAELILKSKQAFREKIKREVQKIFEDKRNRNAVFQSEEYGKVHVRWISGPKEALEEDNQSLMKKSEYECKNNAVIQALKEGVEGHSQVEKDVMESSQRLQDENESLKKTIEEERNKNAVLRVEIDDMNVNYGNLQRALGYLRCEYSYLLEKNKDRPENNDALLVERDVMDHINLEVELGHVLCDNKKLMVENEDLKVQLYDMKLNCENLVHKCHLPQSQNQATIEELQEDILQSINKALQTKINKLEATNEDIQEDKNMLQRDNNTLQANIKQLDATNKDIYKEKPILQKNNDLEAKITEANMEPQESDGLLMNDNLLHVNVKVKIRALEEKGRERLKDLPRQAEVCYGEVKQKKTSVWKTCKRILKHGFKKNPIRKGTSQSNGIDLKQGESDGELNGKSITHHSKKNSKSKENPQSKDIGQEQSDDELNGEIISHSSKKISKSKGNPQSNDIEHGHEQSGDLNGIISTHGSKRNSESKGESHSDDINMKQGKSLDKLFTNCDNEHRPGCSGLGLKAKRKL
ncbi:putative leucine-rich repeat-containing protein DDB_G0290503 [Etheostoma spectabile]|uniref:putative leucine-rich repeat-containing protein DDB_G0290503 n=1 Tax=Etheostoma spectabile TaxID=54343 RepID=UPI0013AF05A7|nr:putative leucine-rich repeat-containing protein DDB_G0290503 [Etheostoma spectabile]